MISIIIVHYQVKAELLACIASIYASKPRSSFEIIVVDNDEKKNLQKELKKQFPKVRYIKNENKGFGEGNNVGARYAKGEYLFFLNPDTTFLTNVIDQLITFLSKHNDAAIVAPLLFDTDKKAYLLQGLRELSPKRAIFALSFIQKIFPKNNIYQEYYLQNWNKKSVKEVDVVPGTAFVIRKKVFEKVEGFDKKFFLYFEEFDLCKRIKDLGGKIFITPQAKVFHAWGSSTKKTEKDISAVFQQSRFYYFKKHFGLLKALATEGILRINKVTILFTLLLLLGLYLRIVYIGSSMTFIGDQGWYYLSARDMLLTGQIPLVGIPSSHPWIHQGALWTYLLAGGLWLMSYSPFAGVYLSIAFGLLCVLAIYKLGSVMFSKRVGIIAAALMATSPLVILLDRMPYHTSPIPFFTIVLLYCLYRWIQGKIIYFPFVILLLAVLYNFELATFLMSMIVMVIWLYGYVAKKDWARDIFHRKIWPIAICLWLMAMGPMLLYDMQHGFPQTLKLFVWVGYRVLVFFGYTAINPITHVSLADMTHFVIANCQQLIFAANGWVALVIGLASFVFLFRKRGMSLLLSTNVFLLFGLFVVKTPSDAYLPLLFPGVVLMIAVLFAALIENNFKVIRVIGILGIFSVISFNSYFSLRASSTHDEFSKRLETATMIVKEAGGKEYTIQGHGKASEFASFTMNYEYLAWWLGHGPSKTEQKVRFTISEENGRIEVSKEER